MLHIENNGPLIVSSNFWGSEHEQAGKLYISCNGGAIRVMVPSALQDAIADMQGAEYAILSRGPWPAQRLPEAVEILFEDRSENPYVLHLSPESFDLLPAEPPANQGWILTVWDLQEGKPRKAIELPCHWRRVPKIPWLKPL